MPGQQHGVGQLRHHRRPVSAGLRAEHGARRALRPVRRRAAAHAGRHEPGHLLVAEVEGPARARALDLTARWAPCLTTTHLDLAVRPADTEPCRGAVVPRGTERGATLTGGRPTARRPTGDPASAAKARNSGASGRT